MRRRKWWWTNPARVPFPPLGRWCGFKIQTATRFERHDALSGRVSVGGGRRGGERQITVPPGRRPAWGVPGGGGRSLPRWHQLHFLIASSPSPASRRVRLNGAGEPAARQRLLRALKMSGSLARCVAPGNNAMRSPAASEQHDDEGQAASLHHLPPR